MQVLGVRFSFLAPQRRLRERLRRRAARAGVAPLAAVAALTAVAARASAQSPEEQRSVFRGAIVGGGYEQASFGRAIPGRIGVETAGIESFAKRRVLATWDGVAAAALGYAGNEHPGFWFWGGQLDLAGEIGARLTSENAWSPYLGAGGSLDVSEVTVSGAPFDNPRAMNNLDGLAGGHGALTTRVSWGVSRLDAAGSLLLTGLFQEALRAPGSWSAATLFYETGVHARYDLWERAALAVEATYGVAPPRSDATFRSTSHARHAAAEFVARFRPRPRFWLELDARIDRDYVRTVYAGSPIEYDTATIPSLAAHFVLGWVLE